MKRRIMTFMICMIMLASMMVMPMNALASGKYMTVTSNVNLRSNDNINDVVGTLKKGTTVYYTGKKYKAFYQIKTSKGKTGYVFKMYLKDAGSKGEGMVCRVKSNSVLYKKASTDSRKVASLMEGRYVQIISTGDGWAYVRTTNDKKGYIPTSQLKK